MKKHSRLIRSTHGIELVRQLAQEGIRIFTTSEARDYATIAGISSGYLNEALFHLVKTGWLIRLQKGLYAISSAMPGINPVHEFEIAMALTNPAAISHWSALHYHGLTEQIPHRIFVLTTKTATIPRPESHGKNKLIHIQKANYQFIRVTRERFFGIEKIWIGEAQVYVTDPEKTLLDGLSLPKYCGGFTEILHAFEIYRDRLNISRIIRYALKLDGAVAKRLGWVLEHVGIKARKLNRLASLPIKGYRPLDSSAQRTGKYNTRWMVQENITGKFK